VSKKIKVDMSREAVAARIKRACGLGDAERLAMMIRPAMAGIAPANLALRKKTPPKKKRTIQ
jgi:hypothetical protein